MSLQELEVAVSNLPADELTAFARWFEEYLADAWARVGLRYRALARDRAEGPVWFWIGPHGEYDRLLKT